MKLLKHLPNILTLTNLAAGVYALIYIDLTVAIVCMLVSLIADVFDGAVARMLNVASPIGKVLDSLADLVSFCVMPGIVTYKVFLDSGSMLSLGLVAAIFYILMGCLRLARFTVNDNEKIDFKGLPTPASAIAVVSLWLLFDSDLIGTSPVILSITLILLGLLNVSTLTMMSVKDIMSNGFKKVAFTLNVLIGVVTYFVSLPCTLVAMISVYLLISLFYHIRSSKEL